MFAARGFWGHLMTLLYLECINQYFNEPQGNLFTWPQPVWEMILYFGNIFFSEAKVGEKAIEEWHVICVWMKADISVVENFQGE